MSNADTALSLLNAWAAGDASIRDQLTDDFTFSGPVPVPLNRDQFAGLSQAIHRGAPDWNFNAGQPQENGATIVIPVQITGTNTGELADVIPGVPPVAPTGKSFSLPTEHISITFRDDKVSHVSVDTLPGGGIPGMYAQIGHPLPPPPGQ
jgi:SnoaL-like protein